MRTCILALLCTATTALTLCCLSLPLFAEAAKPGAEAAKPGAEAAKPGVEAAKPGAETFFSQGRDALFTGRYETAVDRLTQAVAADPKMMSYRLYLARAHRYAGNDVEAVSQLETILKTAPDHVEAGQMLADIHTRAKRWKEVVQVTEPLLKYRHDYPTYHMLATAEYHLDMHDKAREHFKEAIKLNPQSGADHYALGNIDLASNAFALAAEAYEAALRLGLDSPVLRYKLGSAYFNLRNYFGQISVQTVRSGAPDTINDRWYLIEHVPGRNDAFRCAPEASAAYQIAKALADGLEKRPDIEVLRATIYLNARRYAQACTMFDKISSTVPDEDKALVYYYHAQAAFGTGQHDRYLELLHQAIELNPEAYQSTLVDAFTRVADQYNQAGQLDKYIEYLAAAVTESPLTASLHLRLGDAYEEAEQHAKAVAQWRMVLDLEPEHPSRMTLLNQIGE